MQVQMTLAAATVALLVNSVPHANANLILNDSFENDGINSSTLICPISNWSLSLSCASINAGETSTHDSILDGHAEYLAIGTVGQLGFASQSFATVVGQKYAFEFSFSSDGATGNTFEALWNGGVVMDVSNAAFNPDWSGAGTSDMYNFIETATSTITTVSFGGEGNGTSYIGVDDVSVDPVPEPASLALFSTALAGLVAVRRRKRKAA